MAIAEYTIVIDGIRYKKGDTIPDFGSIGCVKASGMLRKYTGLQEDVDKLPMYVSDGSMCTMVDSGNIYIFESGEWVLHPLTIDELESYIDERLEYATQTDTTLTESGKAADAKKVGDEIGDLSDLETEDKSNLVSAINEAAQSGGGGGGGSSPLPYTNTPANLGVASAGSSAKYSRGDHVHAMPTASDVGALPSNTSIPSTAADVGAIAAPANPSSGDFLTYNGTAWVATSLSTWNGGNY